MKPKISWKKGISLTLSVGFEVALHAQALARGSQQRQRCTGHGGQQQQRQRQRPKSVATPKSPDQARNNNHEGKSRQEELGREFAQDKRAAAQRDDQ